MTDGIDAEDEIIKEFLVECEEHFASLDNSLVVIDKDPTDRKTLSCIFRSIHRIKGGEGCSLLTIWKSRVSERFDAELPLGLPKFFPSFELNPQKQSTLGLIKLEDMPLYLYTSIENRG